MANIVIEIVEKKFAVLTTSLLVAIDHMDNESSTRLDILPHLKEGDSYFTRSEYVSLLLTGFCC
jgi:hypothetical protein